MDDLGLDPNYSHRIWVKIAGYMMSEEAQDQRDALAEWFLRSNFEEDDMDSVYVNKDTTAAWKVDAKYMVFAFKDPSKAIQFKLAWG